MQAGVLLSIFFRAASGCFQRRLPNNLLGEWAEQWQRWLVAGWPKTSQSENKSDDTIELENRRDLAMATPRKGFPFYNSTESNGHPNWLRKGLAGRSGGCHTWLDNGRPVRSRWRDRGRGKRDDWAMLRRRTIVALKRMGSNGRENWPGWWDCNKENLAKHLTDTSFARFSIPRIWTLWSADHGLISDRGLSCLGFLRTLIAPEKLFSKFLNLSVDSIRC
jgi:hypothetical protein